MNTHPSLHRRRQLAQWLSLFLVLLVWGGYIGHFRYREYIDIESQQRAQLHHQASVLEASLSSSIVLSHRAIEGILKNIPRGRIGEDRTYQTSQKSKIISAPAPIRTLMITSSSGRVLASNQEQLLAQDISGQSIFQTALNSNNTQVLYVAPPSARHLNEGVLTMARIIVGPEGEFSGVVVVDADQAHLSTLLNAVRYAPDVRALVSQGGSASIVLADTAEYLATDKRLTVSRTLQPGSLPIDKPLVIGVSRDLTSIFANWHRANVEQARLFCFLILVATLSLLAYQRHARALSHIHRKREQALRTSEARLQSIFDATPDAMLISDDQGKIVMANQRVERVLGYRVAELVGMSIEDLIPMRSRTSHPVQRGKYGVSPEPRPMGYGLAVKALQKDGRECDVEVSLSRIQTDELMFFACALRDISERMRFEEQLRIAAVALESHHGVVVTDAVGVILRVNRAFTKMTGYSSKEATGKRMNFFKSNRHDKRFYAAIWRKILSTGTWEGEIWNRNKNGDVCPHWITIAAVRSHDDLVSHYVGTYTDISQRKKDESDLCIAAAAFESQLAMVITDVKGVILRVNQAFVGITGYAAGEVVGENLRHFQSGRHSNDFYRAMWESIARTGGWQGEVWDQRKNGEFYPKWLTLSAIRDEGDQVTHYIGTHYDITDRKKAEEVIHELAFFDQLTGLANRTLLLDRLKQALTASARSASFGALLFIDLDNFKTLNDTLGHDVGDLLLKQVAQRLRLCVREGDTVARLGGDEFVVVLAGLSASKAEAASAGEAIAEKILCAFNKVYHLGDVAHNSTASLGVTLFNGDGATIDDLMKQADLAMYKSKSAGRNLVRFFDPTLETAVKARATLEADLRRAVNEKQFLIHYQAQVVGDGRVIGAEALVRWQHPERGIVSPAEFIPMAEETGLILSLGHWVLETACCQLAQWAKQSSMAHLTLAVNVSAHQFNAPGFVQDVLQVLRRTGANPALLKLELTESLLVHNVQEVAQKMVALKKQGVGFALDDFGVGFSSLSYLKLLPLDHLKIDQSFVRDVLNDPNDAAIAQTIVALASSLGLGVIAEGVETDAQRRFLAESGCHAYQGYFFNRPLPLLGFEAYVQGVPNQPGPSRV